MVKSKTSKKRERRVSLDGEDNNFNGLFALLKVANEIEVRTKEENNVRSCGNKFCEERNIRGKWLRRKINGMYTWLCEKCANSYSKKQYCEYCKQIYIKSNDLSTNGWIQCATCKQWSHINCEKLHSTKKGIETLLLDPLFVFNCSECEKLNISGKRGAKKRSSHTKL